jgi:hypothetical protein
MIIALSLGFLFPLFFFFPVVWGVGLPFFPADAPGILSVATRTRSRVKISDGSLSNARGWEGLAN